MQQLPEKRNPTHHLESRNYILNVRDISRNIDNADDKLNENLVMEMKRCLILYAALKSAIYLLSWSCNPGAIKFYERLGLAPYKIGMETLL